MKLLLMAMPPDAPVALIGEAITEANDHGYTDTATAHTGHPV